MSLRDIRRKSAEQMVDFLGEAMMKKQESNLGLVFCIFRQVPLCCEVGDEVGEITFYKCIMTDGGAKYTCAVKGSIARVIIRMGSNPFRLEPIGTFRIREHLEE